VARAIGHARVTPFNGGNKVMLAEIVK
jgi:hypothetical protein